MMLHRLDLVQSASLPDFEHPRDRREPPEEGAAQLLLPILGMARRQAWLVVSGAVLGALLGVAYIELTPPTYTASATITVETRRAGLAFGGDSVGGQEGDSYVEIIKSGKIALKVIDELGLRNDPEFYAGRNVFSPFLLMARRLLGKPAQASTPDPSVAFHNAAQMFKMNLDVKRVGGQALEISFQSLSPQRAAAVVNSVVDAFISDQVDATQLSAKSSGVWLQTRLTKLRSDAEDAEQAVVDFKKRNEIVEVEGKILVGQRLTDINAQLMNAKVQRSELAAKLQAVRDGIASGGDILVVDIKESDTLNRARQQLADLLARERDWSARYGSEHAAVVNIRSQIQSIRFAIAAEFERLANVYARDLEIAEARLKTLEAEFNGAIADSFATGQLQVGLRELESTAKTYRNIYDSFLQRHAAAVQQESFPSSAARVLTLAEPPIYSNASKALLVFAGSLALGLGLGAGLGFLREVTDHIVRRPEQVEDGWRVRNFGLLPCTTPPRATADKTKGGKQPGLPLLRHVLSQPSSPLTESIRSIKFQIERMTGGGGAVIAMTSPDRGEGKSTLAANLAELMALSGRPTVLIDCDVIQPTLSENVAPGLVDGLLALALCDVSTGEATRKALSHVDFIPAGSLGQVTHVSELLASPGMAAAMQELRSAYSFVVLDLPPATLSSDARVLASMSDIVIIVAQFGKTRTDRVKRAVEALQTSGDQVLGVVINKVDSARFHRSHPIGNNA